MRLALLIYGSLDTVSGGYLYDRMVVEQLQRRGHSVEIVSLPWRGYWRHLGDNVSASWRKRLAALSVDLVLQDELNHPSLAFVNPRTRTHGPRAISIVHHLRAGEPHPALLRTFYRWVERRYLERVEGFVYNSRTTRAGVTALIRRPEPPSIVAYPAADHIAHYATGTATRAQHADAPLHLLFVGNVIPRKGLHTVLDALALARAPLRLSVVGSTTADRRYAKALRRKVAQHGLEARVRFLGPVSDADKAHLYGTCDLLALPSFEGFGIVYLEAMAFGMPVLAATAGAAHEIVTDGVDGFLVPFGDAAALAARLEQLNSDRVLLQQMRAAARLRFERHPSWADTGARIARWLEEFHS